MLDTQRREPGRVGDAVLETVTETLAKGGDIRLGAALKAAAGGTSAEDRSADVRLHLRPTAHRTGVEDLAQGEANRAGDIAPCLLVVSSPVGGERSWGPPPRSRSACSGGRYGD